MRVWHYKLLPVLPRQQLIGQWRECCLISKLIAYQKTPNHALVNKVTSYPAWMWMCYQYDLEKEMKRRGYCMMDSVLYAIGENTMKAEEEGYFADDDTYDFMTYMYDPFPGWHNDRYLIQCYFNLEEKYDCGMISEEEWLKIDKFMRSINILIY